MLQVSSGLLLVNSGVSRPHIAFSVTDSGTPTFLLAPLYIWTWVVIMGLIPRCFGISCFASCSVPCRNLRIVKSWSLGSGDTRPFSSNDLDHIDISGLGASCLASWWNPQNGKSRFHLFAATCSPSWMAQIVSQLCVSWVCTMFHAEISESGNRNCLDRVTCFPLHRMALIYLCLNGPYLSSST